MRLRSRKGEGGLTVQRAAAVQRSARTMWSTLGSWTGIWGREGEKEKVRQVSETSAMLHLVLASVLDKSPGVAAVHTGIQVIAATSPPNYVVCVCGRKLEYLEGHIQFISKYIFHLIMWTLFSLIQCICVPAKRWCPMARSRSQELSLSLNSSWRCSNIDFQPLISWTSFHSIMLFSWKKTSWHEEGSEASDILGASIRLICYPCTCSLKYAQMAFIMFKHVIYTFFWK